MGLITGIGRALLIILNMVFLLVGMALLVLGLILKFGSQIYKPILDQALKFLEETGKKISTDFKFNSDDLGEILSSLSVGLIVAGIFLSAFTIFGCCGGCYKIKCMLLLYGIIIVVLLVAEIILIGLLYGKKDIIKQPLKDGLKDYKGATGLDIVSLGWNIVMLQFSCCGVDSYNDFNVGKDWQVIVFQGFNVSLTTPLACCKKLPSSFQDAMDCAVTTPISETLSNAYISCFDKIWDHSLGNTGMAVGILVACGVFQILLIAFAYIIYKSDDKVNPV